MLRKVAGVEFKGLVRTRHRLKAGVTGVVYVWFRRRRLLLWCLRKQEDARQLPVSTVTALRWSTRIPLL